MKDNFDIDELLNGFIDEELTQRQLTEVQRLIANDQAVLERLKQLQEVRTLLSSLPQQEAPADIIDQVRASLERNTLLSHQGPLYDKQGARHLLMRNLLSIAAMVALVAILGVVIYGIVAPVNTSEKYIASNYKKKTDSVISEPVATAAANPAVVKDTIVEPGIDAALVLKTGDVPATVFFINKAIESSIPSGQWFSSGTAKAGQRYLINCNRQNLVSLLNDMESIWPKFNSASLTMETSQTDKQIKINNVQADQMVQIAKGSTVEEQIKVANNFAALNDIAGRFPAKNMLAADTANKGLVSIPKPVLTSNQNKNNNKTTQIIEDNARIALTILVTAEK